MNAPEQLLLATRFIHLIHQTLFEGSIISTTLKYLAAMAACTLFGTSASARSAKDIRGPSPLVAIENEATAKLIVGFCQNSRHLGIQGCTV